MDMKSYSYRTWTCFSLAEKNQKQDEDLRIWLFQTLLTLRYNVQQDFEVTLNQFTRQWRETNGFRDDPNIILEDEPYARGGGWDDEDLLAESSTKNKNKDKQNEEQTEDISGNNDDHSRMIFDDNNSLRGYQQLHNPEVEEEREETSDINQLMVRTLQEMMKELRQKPKTSSGLRYKKESRLVDFPTFSGGDQDPITWLDGFKQACIANNVEEDRMLAIAASYLKGTALTWYKKSNIKCWEDSFDTSQSFIHQFKKQYCSNFRKAQWKQTLRNHKQKPGETVESYTAKLYELWHRIDPEHKRDESDRIQEFMEGLRPEFIIHVQASMPDTVDKAVDKAKSVEIGLSMNMSLSDYSLNEGYLKKTNGGAIPLRHALAINDEPSVEQIIEDKLQRGIDLLASKLLNQQSNGNNNPRPSSNSNRDVTCFNCNKKGHMARDCRSKTICRKCKREGHTERNCGKKCNFCQRWGHVESECRTKRNQSQRQNTSRYDDEEDLNEFLHL